jgi:transposase-like protein
MNDKTENVIMVCHNCGGTDFVKNGFRHGMQCFKCKTCGWQYTKATRYSKKEIAIALELSAKGLSCRTIAKLLGAKPNTICVWKNRANNHLAHIEWKEVCVFVNSRQSGCGFSKRIKNQIGTIIQCEQE